MIKTKTGKFQVYNIVLSTVTMLHIRHLELTYLVMPPSPYLPHPLSLVFFAVGSFRVKGGWRFDVLCSLLSSEVKNLSQLLYQWLVFRVIIAQTVHFCLTCNCSYTLRGHYKSPGPHRRAENATPSFPFVCGGGVHSVWTCSLICPHVLSRPVCLLPLLLSALFFDMIVRGG